MISHPNRRRLLAAVAAAAALSPLVAPLSVQAAAPPAPALSADDQALVDRAVAYLQGLSEAKGRFTQTDGRGPATSGELFLKRPGKARFAYDPPSGLLVVSDGGRVIVQDKRLNTFTAYPLGATPLSLFLAKTIRLDKGVQVTRVARAADGFTITAQDGGRGGKRETAGQIAIAFVDNPMRLVSWTVTDAQGRATQVRISDLQKTSGLDPSLFVLKNPNTRAPDPGRLGL